MIQTIVEAILTHPRVIALVVAAFAVGFYVATPDKKGFWE